MVAKLMRYAAALMAMAIACPTRAQFGLDPNFHGDGRSEWVSGSLVTMEVLLDQKILAGGMVYLDSVPPFASHLLLARFAANGALDPLFGSDGVVVMSFDTVLPWGVLDIAIQPDNAIMAMSGLGLDSMFVARFLPNGGVDSTFGDQGVAFLDLGSVNEMPCAVQVQPDGKTVIAGMAYLGTDLDVFLMRLTPDGERDSTFGVNGLAVAGVPAGCNENIFHLIIQPDGKYLVEGSQDFCWDGANTLLLRFNADGTMDPGFGADGIVLEDIGGGMMDWSRDMHLLEDQRIVISGVRESGNSIELFLARFMNDGTLDPSFGDMGVSAVLFPFPGVFYPTVLQAMPDGGFFLSGTHDDDTSSYHRHSILHFSADGEWDASFGNEGIYGIVPATGSFTDAAVHADGGLLINEYGSVPEPSSILKFANGSAGIVPMSGTNDMTGSVYPDPIVDAATLSYSLAQPDVLSCSILDEQGRTVRTVFDDGKRQPGDQRESLNLSGVSPGCYWVVLRSSHIILSIPIVKQ